MKKVMLGINFFVGLMFLIITFTVVAQSPAETTAMPEVKYGLLSTVKITPNNTGAYLFQNRSKRLLIANLFEPEGTKSILGTLMSSKTLDENVDQQINSLLTSGFCETPGVVKISELDNKSALNQFYDTLGSQPSTACFQKEKVKGEREDTVGMLRKSLIEVSCSLGNDLTIEGRTNAISAWAGIRPHFKRGFCMLDSEIPTEINAYRQIIGRNDMMTHLFALEPLQSCADAPKICINDFSKAIETQIFVRYKGEDNFKAALESITFNTCFNWVSCKLLARRALTPSQALSRLIFLEQASSFLQTMTATTCEQIEKDIPTQFSGYPEPASMTTAEQMQVKAYLDKMGNINSYLPCKFDKGITHTDEIQSATEFISALSEWFGNATIIRTKPVIDDCPEALYGYKSNDGKIPDCLR